MQPAQRPVASLAEQGERAVLGREEDEHDGHRRAVEGRHRGLALPAARSRDDDRAGRRGRRCRGGRSLPGRPGRHSPRSSGPPAGRSRCRRRSGSTTARATSRAVTLPPARIRISAGWPVADRVVKPAGMTIATPGPVRVDLGRGGRRRRSPALTSAIPLWSSPARTSSREQAGHAGRRPRRRPAIVVWKVGVKSGMIAAKARARPSGVRTAKMIAERSRSRWRRIRRAMTRAARRRSPPSPAGPCRSGGGRRSRGRAR